jgi:hypothetical protein
MGSTRREFVKLAAAAAAAPGLQRLCAQTRTESGGSIPNLGRNHLKATKYLEQVRQSATK